MFIYVEKKRLGDFKVNQLRKTPCPLVEPKYPMPYGAMSTVPIAHP